MVLLIILSTKQHPLWLYFKEEIIMACDSHMFYSQFCQILAWFSSRNTLRTHLCSYYSNFFLLRFDIAPFWFWPISAKHKPNFSLILYDDQFHQSLLIYFNSHQIEHNLNEKVFKETLLTPMIIMENGGWVAGCPTSLIPKDSTPQTEPFESSMSGVGN
jgi:hypothetical protein